MSRESFRTYDGEWIYVLLIYFPIMLIVMIFIVIVDKDARPVLQPVLIALAILFTLIAGMVTYIILANRNKKRREYLKRIREIEAGEAEGTIPPLSEDAIERPTIRERFSRRVVKKEKKLVLNYRKKKLLYKDSIQGKNCPICKLELRKDQVILACPQCKTPFHEDHLIDWLNTGNNCPVCGEAFAIIESKIE